MMVGGWALAGPTTKHDMMVGGGAWAGGGEFVAGRRAAAGDPKRRAGSTEGCLACRRVSLGIQQLEESSSCLSGDAFHFFEKNDTRGLEGPLGTRCTHAEIFWAS
jgi:hypothetical protein